MRFLTALKQIASEQARGEGKVLGVYNYNSGNKITFKLLF